MFYVYYQEQNKIELVIDGDLTKDEFRQMIHQIESLCTMYNQVDVLFDATNVGRYDFSVLLDEFEFYARYHKHLRKVAIVADDKFNAFMLKIFNAFTQTEFKTFTSKQTKDARKWIFPSRLPG